MTTQSFHLPSADDLKPYLMGKRIVSAEMTDDHDAIPPYRDDYSWRSGTTPVGTLTLDDGTVLKVWGHDGGCACSAGCYYLQSVAETDNIITDVAVHEDPEGDGYECRTCGSSYCYDDSHEQPEGVYRIFVFCDNEQINVAEFEGDDGNGYYGTGFHVAVTIPE